MDNPVVLIIIDALGYELAEKYGFMPDGLHVRRKLRTVPGFSQSALTSILTGCRPDEHNLWMMYSFSADSSPLRWLSLLPDGVSARRRWLRRLIGWKLRKIDGMKSYYSLYSVPRQILAHIDFPARKNIFLPGGAGGTKTVIDEFKGRNARIFIRDYHTPEKESFADLREALARGVFDFYMLYTAGLDSSLHRFGTSHREIEKHLKWYSGQLEEIASAVEDAEITVLGDHGMCDVIESVDLISRVEQLDLVIPEDYIPFYDSTMARFRIFNKAAEERLTELLSSFSEGVIISAEEKRRLGIDFTESIYGDIIYLLKEGTVISPSYMGDKPVSGMHGFHPDSECMYSALFSNLERASTVESITDVAGVLLPGFGCRREGTDGTG